METSEHIVSGLRIARALTPDYIRIYCVDPGDDSFIEYSTTKEYQALGVQRAGEDFFDLCRRDAVRLVHPDDRAAFIEALDKGRLLSALEEGRAFALNYRMMVDGAPVYVCLRAAIVAEGGRETLIVGIIDIDARVRRDMEYARVLSEARMRASRDALTGVRNRGAYLDVEAQIDRRIQRGEPVRFAVVVCDLNDLKRTNDSLGHREGDRRLKEACAAICRVFKHSPVFRLGGDEFAVISQGRDYEHMDELMDSMRRSNALKDSGGGVIACGMARYRGDPAVAAVFERADRRMYEEKRCLKAR